ncbi:hypothetical protein CF160_14845 [Enterococcus pseudoavium]|nr:hypothetical protein CF160_14845 [Enterococcus pseudoavium]
MEQGETNYQLARVRATIAKTFWTTRFLMGSHQLRFYLEPKDDIRNVVLKRIERTRLLMKILMLQGLI